jgi:hypothetical protein
MYEYIEMVRMATQSSLFSNFAHELTPPASIMETTPASIMGTTSPN